MKIFMNMEIVSVKKNSIYPKHRYHIPNQKELLNQPHNRSHLRRFQNILIFLKSGFLVTALAFFTALVDP